MTKNQRTAYFYETMTRFGFTHAETETLRLAEKTLHRWAERECNGEIQRHPENDRPYSHTRERANGTFYSYVPDREKGALKRIDAVMSARNGRESEGMVSYHQTDPRGCALYVVKKSEIPKGEDVSSYYNRGFGVCI